MALYDLTASDQAMALLTAKVTGLPPARMEAEQLTAEALLRLRSPAYTLAADVETIALAIAHQMNFQVARGVDPKFTQTATSTHAKQTNVYIDRDIDPVAQSLVDAVALQYTTDGGWGDTFTSHRTRSGTGA